MAQSKISHEYFSWLCKTVNETKRPKQISYEKLLKQLHDTEFRYLISRDRNRAEDGVDLRYRFAMTQGYEYSADWIMATLDKPCSVLEMLIALAIRCEETYTDDPLYGNRTSQWFWGMVANLGLSAMYDSRYNKWTVHDIIETFLNREYEPNGKGGLFTIKNCDTDLRRVEIWHQLCWYLDSIMQL